MIYTQSLVKDIEREDNCLFKWKSRWIDKNPDLKINNEFTERGKFFEQLVLGDSAHENEPVTDLPRLKNGDKSLDQIRIERQAERTRKIISGENELKLILHKAQIELFDGDEQGTADFTMLSPEGELWLIDLKLTKDLTSTRSKYGYGNDWGDMDQLQLTHYNQLYKKNFGVSPRLGLLVVDYSPHERIDFREIILSQNKYEERSLRFLKAKELIEQYSTTEWPKKPSKYECMNCPLQCEMRFKL